MLEETLVLLLSLLAVLACVGVCLCACHVEIKFLLKRNVLDTAGTHFICLRMSCLQNVRPKKIKCKIQMFLFFWAVQTSFILLLF